MKSYLGKVILEEIIKGSLVIIEKVFDKVNREDSATCGKGDQGAGAGRQSKKIPNPDYES